MTGDTQDDQAEALTAALDFPLFVVTTGDGEEMSGCLAGFVTQSSMSPVQFLVCISKINHTFRTAGRSRGLALHLLGSDQFDVASLFGERTGDVMDKFTQVEWSPGETGAPILSDCAAWVEGRIIDRMSGGDHEAFLITVDQGGAGRREGQFMFHLAKGFAAGHPQ